MNSIKKTIKKILPEKVILLYHRVITGLAAFYYRYPSDDMIVIGVTGTKGKTSTVNFIWSVLTAGGYKVGLISSANIRIGKEERLNDYHMTMLGRFQAQKIIKKMAVKNCDFCIIETTSEGLKQHRANGINYDIGIFTNLSPEHLPSHNHSFENYKKAKGKMFEILSKRKKMIDGRSIEKMILANLDDDHADYYLDFESDLKITFGLQNVEADYVAEKIREKDNGVEFEVNGKKFEIEILGKFNIYNALPAIIIADKFKISNESTFSGIKNLKKIPGRMEEIEMGQPFRVIVDYAHEQKSMKNALSTLKKIAGDGKTILLLGAEGGGRDKSKRSLMGKIAAEKADYVIVSNVDPYEDDPEKIIEEIAFAAEENGKQKGVDLFTIADRRAGIKKSLSLAKKGDVVLITGKGAEQSITVDGKTIPWDDRKVVAEELNKMQF